MAVNNDQQLVVLFQGLQENIGSRIDALGKQLNDRIDTLGKQLNGRIDEVNVRIDEVNVRLGNVNGKIEGLKEDVKRLNGRVDRLKVVVDEVKEDVQTLKKTNDNITAAFGNSVESFKTFTEDLSSKVRDKVVELGKPMYEAMRAKVDAVNADNKLLLRREHSLCHCRPGTFSAPISTLPVVEAAASNADTPLSRQEPPRVSVGSRDTFGV